MKVIKPSVSILMDGFLTVVLTFSASLLLSFKHSSQSSANNTNIPEESLLDGAEFIFPEYSNVNPNSVEAQATSAAERDASAHLNKLLWFTTGFSLPVIGVFLSQRNQRSIPGARLLGKSPEYVAFIRMRIELK